MGRAWQGGEAPVAAAGGVLRRVVAAGAGRARPCVVAVEAGEELVDEDDPRGGQQGAELGDELGGREREERLRVAGLVGELAGREERVGSGEHGAEGKHAEGDDGEVERAGREEEGDVAAAEAQRGERAQVREGEGGAVGGTFYSSHMRGGFFKHFLEFDVGHNESKSRNLDNKNSEFQWGSRNAGWQLRAHLARCPTSAMPTKMIHILVVHDEDQFIQIDDEQLHTSCKLWIRGL